ncbi:Deoxycytidylate deaminase [Smittium mucronatum]|uniref:dCMP deaminase n=1 Tax=Smittium mucronatum TaxID=133383 RepID=A0A1R0GYF1_9FUNG|nr:Deoxycytidylate deaminase [Smittium mucronatum]
MRDIEAPVKIVEDDVFESFNTKMDYANYLRSHYNSKDILAALSIGAIRNRRRTIRQGETAEGGEFRGLSFIVRQLKTPEEIQLLRSVYGRLFIQISIYGSPQRREDNLVAQIKINSRGTKDEVSSRSSAKSLIQRDTKEEDEFGQNLGNAFPLGDLFVDSSDRVSATAAISRFIGALFGNNEISPTREEYGMYLAKSASLRSCDLSRQVGAAIFCDTGEVVSLGANEVPKAGGGTYWTGDEFDSRDIMQGHDPNEINKVEIFADVVDRLSKEKMLSNDLLELNNTQAIVDKLFSEENNGRFRDSRIMDIIEFGRIIHAEMSAICDAARNGISVRRSNMYVTTFPCHLCAKHIVASGVRRVVYLEPYPKSYARQLHSDSIQIEEKSDANKVIFQPFMGISPYRYRDLFEKGKRKDGSGQAMKWKTEPRRPMVDNVVPSYLEAESYVVAKLTEILAEKASGQTE